MYEGTTSAFNSKIISNCRRISAKLICGNDVIDSGFKSVKVSNQSTSDTNTVEIGASVAAQIDVNVVKPSFQITGKEFQLYFGLLLDDNTVEYVPIGKFTPQKPTETDDGLISFTAYDRMVSKYKSAYFTDIQSYPVDAKVILEEIQDKTGVTIANLSSLPNGIKVDWRNEISDETTKKVAPFNGYTYRETIAYIAQLYGKFATMNRSGELEFRWYTTCSLQVPANRVLGDIDCAETLFILQKITCTVGNTTITSGSGSTGISISNPVMTQDILDNVFSIIGGMQYLPTACNYLGDPRLDLGDIVKVYKSNGTIISTPVMHLEMEYDGGISSNIASYGSTQESQDNQKGPMATAIDRVYTDLFLVKEVVANKVSVDYLEANYATIVDLDAVSIRVGTLEANEITTDYLSTHYASIDLANIGAGAIKTAMIDVGAIGTVQIADSSITDAKIVSLTANKLTAGTIDAATIDVINLNCANLTVGTINGTQIANGAIDMNKLTESLSTTITNTAEDVSSALSEAGLAHTAADNANEKVDNLQIGSVNLLDDSLTLATDKYSVVEELCDASLNILTDASGIVLAA